MEAEKTDYQLNVTLAKRLFMASHSQPDATHIIARARSSGASLAGVTNIASLQTSSSYKSEKMVGMPKEFKSILVLGLHHKETEPELDWWGGEGGTAGNRRLESIANSLIQWLKADVGLKAHLLPYHAGKGGIFLKDAAALAGLGVIGANNLLITPEFGPHIRLRALLLDVDVEPTGQIDDPCDGCNMPCIQACPMNAFESGSYSRPSCDRQMRIDESGGDDLIKYCRSCELSCPVGK